jgi:hypothetical protein
VPPNTEIRIPIKFLPIARRKRQMVERWFPKVDQMNLVFEARNGRKLMLKGMTWEPGPDLHDQPEERSS